MYPVAHFPRDRQNMALHSPNIILTRSFELVLPNVNHCSKYGPLLPKHGPHMVLKIVSSWILIIVARDVPCQISHCWVCTVALYPRNDQNMALLWQKYGPCMVLQIGSSWILMIVPRDVQCKISHCWVYPLAPFSRNGQNMALYGQNIVLRFGSSQILMCPGMLHAKFHNSGCIP